MNVLLLPLLTLALAPASPPANQLPETIAALVAEQATAGGPGAALAVIHRGKPVVVHAAGLADLDHSIPLNADSSFYLGSLAKQFTAAAVAVLVIDGKLSLDDPIGKHVSPLPDDVARIPLRHLLHHVSGIRDYLKIRDLAGQKNDPFDNADALRIVRAQRSLVFPPGTRYQYSNSNYILLAEAVKAASGRDFAEFTRERIFKPVGMTSTFFETDASSVVPARVISYQRARDGKWRRYMKQFEAVGDGGAYSSLRDLMRWDAVLRSRAGFPAAFFDILLQRPSTPDTPYAGGLLIRPFFGEPAIEHSGFMLGFQHHYLRFPDSDLAIIILTNSREIESFQLREKITRAAFASLVATALPETKASPASNDRPAEPATEFPPLDTAVSGSFVNDEIPLQATLFVRDGKLHIDPASFRAFPLERIAADTFRGLGGEVLVMLGADKARWTLRVRDLGDFVFVREETD